MVLLVRQLRRTSAPYKSTHRHPLHRKKKLKTADSSLSRKRNRERKREDCKSRYNGFRSIVCDEFLTVTTTILFLLPFLCHVTLVNFIESIVINDGTVGRSRRITGGLSNVFFVWSRAIAVFSPRNRSRGGCCNVN